MGLGDTPHSFARTDTNLSVRKKRREPFRKEDCQAAMAGGLAVEGCHLHRPYHSVRGRHLRQCVKALFKSIQASQEGSSLGNGYGGCWPYLWSCMRLPKQGGRVCRGSQKVQG